VIFIDEASVIAQSGNGGRGCVSFRREKFIPRGGPDGGDGGAGGDVIVAVSARLRTLYHFRHQRHFRAQNGAPGSGSLKTGRGGDDIVIHVPPGTILYDAESGERLHDLTRPDQRLTLLKGGRGGKGNTHFKSSTQRTPRFAQPGEPGHQLRLRLELKLLADVGIIGLPNAGKSTLIAAISSARPKVADYPFTTLVPNLGVVKSGNADPFVVADIPGLIEGAHSGSGLGIQFLRHVERTQILVHLIDAATIDSQDPLAAYRTINAELRHYQGDLAEKVQIVVLNKMDLPEARQALAPFKAALGDHGLLAISAATGEGVAALVQEIQKTLAEAS
jgi:GTP-binding protein